MRPGFFAPTWQVTPFQERALEFQVTGDPAIQKMLFPKRDFWILIRDPENPLGAWGSWKPYLELGERLLVLCLPGPIDGVSPTVEHAKPALPQHDARSGGESPWIHCFTDEYLYGDQAPC